MRANNNLFTVNMNNIFKKYLKYHLNEINSENIIRRIYQFLFYGSNAPRSKKTRILISEMKKLNFNIFNLKGMIVKKNDDFLTFSRKSV